MNKIQNIGAAIALALSSTSIFAFENVTPSDAYNMATSDPDTIILDVRTRYEWGFVGHPAADKTGYGAELNGKVINIAFEVVDGQNLAPNKYFIEDVKKILAEKPNAKFITMCRSGHRSSAAAAELEAAGIPVMNMVEGFEGATDANGYRTVNGWKNSSLPYVAACDGNGYDRYKFVLTPEGNMIPSQSSK